MRLRFYLRFLPFVCVFPCAPLIPPTASAALIPALPSASPSDPNPMSLAGKRIPESYERVYTSLCPRNENRISHRIFSLVAKSAQVSSEVAENIWAMLDLNQSNVIDKDGLYCALGLMGMQQSGFEPNLALLQEASELPGIRLENLDSLKAKAVSHHVAPQFSFRELEEGEFIQVSIGKEEGLIKKHTTYSIFSKRRNSTFVRRYSDFEPFDALLRKRFPYRIIPQLPPKTFGGNKNKEFLEKRRKALERYLTFVGRHPVLREDESVKIFFTYEGSDIQTRLKDLAKTARDEFYTNPMAADAGSVLPDEISVSIQSTNNELESVISTMKSLRDTAEDIAHHTSAASELWGRFASDLRQLASTQISNLAGHTKASAMERHLRDASNLMKSVVDRGQEQCVREMDGLVHNLQNLHEILLAFRDLLTRRLKGIAKEMGATTRKLTKERSRLDSGGSDAAESAKLEAKIQQSNAALNSLSAINDFSMYCVWCESKLIRANLAQIGTMLEEMATSQVTGHKQMAMAWSAMLETVNSFVTALSID
eukprot:m.25860 g.25860  ORF g.25860 m.25860 type:complete len:539 (-) comp9936_c1_seq1:263-1879(-)